MCGSVSGIRLIFLRSRAFGSLFEVFLVCAVVSLLLIRGLLALAGFPSIHGSGLHVAHLLWGGLLMLLGILMIAAFIGRQVQTLAMVLAGAGFGTFIDEVGKFVTSDSNYFFRPAVAIAYAVMILVFLLARAFEGRRRFTGAEQLANAFELAREARILGRRPAGTAQALDFLRRHLAADDEVAVALQNELERALELPPVLPGPFLRLRSAALHAYIRTVESGRHGRVVLIGLGGYGALLVTVVAVVARGQTSGVAYAGTVLSFAASIILVGVALATLRSSRAAACVWFERAVLVNLLLGQVFIFYLIQFWALFGVGLDLVLLLLLKGSIRVDKPIAHRNR